MIGKLIISGLFLAANTAGATDYQSVFDDSSSSQANSFFEQAAKANQEDHLAIYYLGRLAMRDRSFEQAIDRFEQALVLNDDDQRYHYWNARVHIANIWNVGTFKRLAYSKRIRDGLVRSLALQPDHLDSLQRLFCFHAIAPKIAGGDINRAQELASLISQYDHALGLEAEAGLLLQDERYAEAEAVYGQAVEADLDNIGIRYRFADFLIRSGKALESLTQIDIGITKAIAAGENRFVRLLGYQMGRAAAISGNSLDRGERALLSYLEEPADGSMPGHDWARFWLGQIHTQQGHSKIAKDTIKMVRRSTDDSRLKDEIHAFLNG